MTNKTPKYRIGQTVKYLPVLSGLKKNHKFVIRSVVYKTSDDLCENLGIQYEPTWLYSFEGTSLSAEECDIVNVNKSKNGK